MLLRIFNLVFLAAFLLSALVQLNDPDAAIWIAIYLAAAAMCLLRHLNDLPRWLAPALCLIALGWSALLTPLIIGEVSPAEVFESLSMRTRAVEEAREIGGLLLVALWSGVLTFRQRRG